MESSEAVILGMMRELAEPLANARLRTKKLIGYIKRQRTLLRKRIEEEKEVL